MRGGLNPRLLPLLLLCACASSTRNLSSEADFVDASAVEYDASFDEVYDAAWLSLEKLGFKVVAHDRRAGTFTAGPSTGTGYDVQATPRETKVRLQLSVRAFRDGQPVLSDGPGRDFRRELEPVSALHAQVRALTDAWKHVPELSYLKVGHAVWADGVRLPLPETWNVLDLRTDRHFLKLQQLKRANQGINPTLLVLLDRRRPLPSTAELATEAAQLAVPDAKPVVPESDARSAVLLGGKLAAWTQVQEVSAEPFDLDCLSFATETLAWTLKAAAVCPRPLTPENAPDKACVSAVRTAFDSARRDAGGE
jgi:hypothetical protein